MVARREQIVRLIMWEIGKTLPDSQKEFDRTVEYMKATIEALKHLDNDNSRFTIVEGTIGQIRRGVAQSATIGYWVGVNHAGQGYMSRALRAALAYCFSNLRLHRVEAACLPSNIASIRVLESAGFKREGLARSYLRINGRWQDHLLFAVLENDPPLPPRLRARDGVGDTA